MPAEPALPSPGAAPASDPSPPVAGGAPDGDERPAHAEAAGEQARTAGRGGLAIAGAKVSFIVLGFVQQLILPRLVGPSGYGDVSLVLALVGIVNNVVVAMAIQGVSHAVASAPEGRAPEAFRRTLRVHVVIAVGLALGCALLAGRAAAWEGAPQIALPLRVATSVVFLYGLYAPLIGSLNGRRRFTTQAGLDVGYGVLRTVGIAVGALVFLRAGGSGVVGAILGFVVAATLILPVALLRAGTGRAGAGGPSVPAYLRFLLPLGVGQVFLNLLLQADFVLLSFFVGHAAEGLGRAPAEASALIGVYRGVSLFGFLPYQMLISITFVLFPMLARAHAGGDGDAMRDFTRTGVRLALLTTGLMCGVISALAPHVLRFAFPDEVFWTEGGPALRVLSLGLGSFAVLGITCAALTSLKRAGAAALLTASALALVATACAATVPRATFGPAMLLQSATSTSIALTAVAVVAAVVLRRVAGGFASPATLLRVLLALGAAIAVGSRLPWVAKLFVPVEAAAVAGVYVAVLLVTRELGAADVARLKQVFGRRRRA